jgi:hypothetical protein
MKEKLLKLCGYLLQVVLTALASAGIALLQNYLTTKGVPAGAEINPTETGAIGSMIASARIAISNIKFNSTLS